MLVCESVCACVLIKRQKRGPVGIFEFDAIEAHAVDVVQERAVVPPPPAHAFAIIMRFSQQATKQKIGAKNILSEIVYVQKVDAPLNVQFLEISWYIYPHLSNTGPQQSLVIVSPILFPPQKLPFFFADTHKIAATGVKIPNFSVPTQKNFKKYSNLRTIA